jgi:predicted CopG family antitoxin
MAHKTITISEEAYEALAGMKAAKESFTDVILKIVKKKEEGTLLDCVRSIGPDEEFAKTLEDVVKERKGISVAGPHSRRSLWSAWTLAS